eukprot:jgi/Ulvmu1/5310/UM022_0104.1
MNYARRKKLYDLLFSQQYAGRDAAARYATLSSGPSRQFAVRHNCARDRTPSLAQTFVSQLRVSRWHHQPSRLWLAIRHPLPLVIAACGAGAGLIQVSQGQATPAPIHRNTSQLAAVQYSEAPSVLSRFTLAAHMCFRTIVLLSVLVPLLATYPLANLHPVGRRAWLRMLHHSLKYCGPAWAKWGQWASARPDLLPTDVRQVLEMLHTAVPAHSAAATRSVLQKSLPLPFDEVFERFEWEPIASGAIAQVHRAWLKPAAAELCGASPDEVRRMHAPRYPSDWHALHAPHTATPQMHAPEPALPVNPTLGIQPMHFHQAIARAH